MLMLQHLQITQNDLRQSKPEKTVIIQRDLRKLGVQSQWWQLVVNLSVTVIEYPKHF